MDQKTIIDYVTESPHNTNKAILSQMLDEYEEDGTQTNIFNSNMLIAVNSPKGSPSNPNNYELMVSENGIDWSGVPSTVQFAGDIPLGSETHVIKYQDYYIFTAGADNGRSTANYDVLFAYTKDFITFQHIFANFSIPRELQSNLSQEDQNRWAPCLIEDKNGKTWITISVQAEKTIEPKYPFQSGRVFKQYIFPVQFNFSAATVVRTGEFTELTFDKSYVNIIDATIYWSQKENKYVCTFKDNHECVVNIAVADEINGNYTVIKEDLFDAPFTESGFVCELNGSYFYSCVNHNGAISPLCNYVGYGDTLGKIGSFREAKYSGSLKNLNNYNNTYLRMRMIFPIIADELLKGIVYQNGAILVNNLPERSIYVAKPSSILSYRNSFTAFPNVCYDLEGSNKTVINFTNTSGCDKLLLKGTNPCLVTINNYEVIQNQSHWRQEYIWDGSLWRVSGYTKPYALVNFDNDYIGGIKIAVKDNNILMFSGLPEFKVNFNKNVTQTIGSSESMGDNNYKVNFRIKARGAYLVVYQGALIGEICLGEGVKDNIFFKPFVDIEAGTVGELCCPAMAWNT